MAYVAGDVVRLVVKQLYDSQQVLNVFYYQVGALGGGGITPVLFGSDFWGTVKAHWRNVVSNQLIFDRITIENLDGDLSYGEYVVPTAERPGLLDGQEMSSFVQYPIQMNRTSRLTRQGAKRICGVLEVYVGDYGLIDTAQLANLQLLANDFASDLMSGAAVLAAPVIVGFPNENRPARVVVDVDTATAKPYVSTQNTRKRGYGS